MMSNFWAKLVDPEGKFTTEINSNAVNCTSSRGKKNALEFKFSSWIDIDDRETQEFTIEVDGLPGIDQKYHPVILTTKSVYLSVNKKHLKLGELRIIQQGDCIVRTQKKQWIFHDYRDGCSMMSHIDEPELQHRFFIEKNLTSERTDDSSKVYLAHDVFSLKTFAIKTQSKKKLEDNLTALGHNEITAMRQLKHPNVLKLIEVIEEEKAIEDPRVFLVTELMNTGDLYALFGNQKSLEEDECKFLTHQVSSGLKYIHEQGLAHRDVKPENILVHQKYQDRLYKLGDLEFICADMSRVISGTENFMSPELLQCNGNMKSYSGIKSDMWSLGVTLHAVLTCKLPNGEQLSLDSFEYVSLNALDLVKKLLTIDVNLRISSADIHSHPWFNEDNLRQRIERTAVVFGLNKKKETPKKVDQPKPARRRTIHSADTAIEEKQVRRGSRFTQPKPATRKSMRLEELQDKYGTMADPPRRKSIYYERRVKKAACRKTMCHQ